MTRRTASLRRAIRPSNGAADIVKSGSSTHERLILATERLVARHGVEGVSMRQIGQAAGMSNNSGVQYHFGTKERLIEAVIAFRQPFLSVRRRELLARLGTPHAPTTREILEILLRPVTEVVDDAGEHVYARFLWQLQRPDVLGERTVHLPMLAEREDEFPRLLQKALGHGATPMMGVVARSAFAMFLFMLVSRGERSGSEFDLETTLQLGVAMVEGGLTAAATLASAG